MSLLSFLGFAASVQAVVLAVGWATASALRHHSPATRHYAWTLAVLGALVVPWAGVLVPQWDSAASVTGLNLMAHLPSRLAAAPGAPMLPANLDPAWPRLLAVVWGVGALLVALRFARGWFVAWKLGWRAVPTVDPHWLTSCRSASDLLNIRGDVMLARSAEIETPLTLGLFHPRVLLPVSADGWSAARLNAVLLHELGHVRRRDLAVQAAAQLVCVLCWYNPLAWLAARRLRKERELAADDLVLSAGVRPSAYAADLVAIARGRFSGALADGAACMAESPLSVRVLRILDQAVPRAPMSRHVRFAMWGLAVVAVVGTAAAGPGAKGIRMPGQPAVSFVRVAFTAITTPPLTPPSDDPAYLPGVQAALQSNLAELQRCYETRLSAQPHLEGNMAMEYVISPNGTFEDGCLVDVEEGVELLDSDLGDCVRDLSVHTQYPPWSETEGPSRAVTVTYHFSSR